ncbi:MAG: orotate phosphoribosyltransferase [Candidatus Pacebacteria bacterium]|nr:orotate phosphoribosyltransferase [Candidatus Paceibacterota bacterium]MBP9842950.1 orotate phosphoribosyltransferase [Candidatus Paceibacterota bacterium]
MMKPADVLIQHALKIGALELLPEGRELKSGRVSPYFFNSGLFTNAISLNILSKTLGDTFKEHWGILGHPTVIFGPAYKGITLSTLAVSNLGHPFNKGFHGVQYAHDRKEEKAHGEGGRIVGASLKDQRVVIIDDVITTGGTKDDAVELITEQGGTTTGLVVLFDRQERSSDSELSAAQEFSKKHHIPIVAVATLKDLIEFIQSHTARSSSTRGILELIKSYQKEYGVY